MSESSSANRASSQSGFIAKLVRSGLGEQMNVLVRAGQFGDMLVAESRAHSLASGPAPMRMQSATPSALESCTVALSGRGSAIPTVRVRCPCRAA
jgi:hypothetical protein